MTVGECYCRVLVDGLLFVSSLLVCLLFSGDDVWRPGGGVDRDNEDENGAAADDGWGTTTNDNDADGTSGCQTCCVIMV